MESVGKAIWCWGVGSNDDVKGLNFATGVT